MKLSRTQVGTDPVRALQAWSADAQAQAVGGCDEYTLATADAMGAPDARVVVIRSIAEDGLTFYSDTRSRKAEQLRDQSRAALVGFWPELSRQVRLRGSVEIAPSHISDRAYESRARRSQIGYWSNVQSAPIEGRAALERQLDETLARFGDRRPPRPVHWVVYRFIPDFIEFWQAGERHLHDRIGYTRITDGWEAQRFQP